MQLQRTLYKKQTFVLTHTYININACGFVFFFLQTRNKHTVTLYALYV